MDYYERQERIERWILWAIAIAFGLLFLSKWAMAATIQATVSWDGKDATGQVEQSVPVLFTLYDSDTLNVLAAVETMGAVTDQPFPAFGYGATGSTDHNNRKGE